MNKELKPFIIISSNGDISGVLLTNEKGYKKSIENGQIWAVNPDTHRLLPEESLGRPAEFRERGDSGSSWYEAVIPVPAERKIASLDIQGESAVAAGAGMGSAVIEQLFTVIEARKKELPEGSYTTHLFNSGISKIKKKTGEEAVELLLAENRDEIIYEAADLIYHMLVLLSAADINPAEIFNELKNRE